MIPEPTILDVARCADDDLNTVCFAHPDNPGTFGKLADIARAWIARAVAAEMELAEVNRKNDDKLKEAREETAMLRTGIARRLEILADNLEIGESRKDISRRLHAMADDL